MGLDATVYCDCFETGRLKEPPPFPSLTFITPDGSLGCRTKDLDTHLSFDRWLRDRACEHENGILLDHRIGNVALVGFLRDELSREAKKFPVLLGKVLYEGTHSGDHLSPDDVKDLRSELDDLEKFVCVDKDGEYVESFRLKMRELVEAALRVSKPIAF